MGHEPLLLYIQIYSAHCAHATRLSVQSPLQLLEHYFTCTVFVNYTDELYLAISTFSSFNSLFSGATSQIFLGVNIAILRVR